PAGPRTAGRGDLARRLSLETLLSSEHQTRLDRHVTRHPPLTGTRIIINGAQDNLPLTGRGVPICKVDTPIVIVIARYWDVAAGTPLLKGNSRPPHSVKVAFGAVDDPPLASRRPPDREISPPVAVVIGGHRNVAGITPLLSGDAACGTVDHPP